MAKIDALSLVLGVLLSIVITGFYDSVFYFLQLPAKMTEFNSSFWATIITFIIFALYTLLFFFLFKKDEKTPVVAIGSNERNRSNFDKDIELQKIQIAKDTFQSYFNLGGSILTGTLVGLSVLILTLYMLYPITEVILILVIGGVVAISFLWMDKQNKKFLKIVDDWVKQVEEGKQLPSITEMEKQIKIFK